MLADGETYLASGGDFLTLDSGLILGLAHDGADRGFLMLFDFAAGTSTVVGQVPLSFGAALSGGRVYLAASTGEILVLDGIPTTASEAPLATSVVATTGLPCTERPRARTRGVPRRGADVREGPRRQR